MVVGLRYVNKHGCIIERILGIVHVPDTTSRVLKQAIDSIFVTYGLSISRMHGQGFDGASNMSGNVSGLKSLILAENQSAYYVYCFAHQLQLTLVSVAKKHEKLCLFFDNLASLTNLIGISCKRKEMLRVKQFEKVVDGISKGTVISGKGLNQEVTLKRPGDRRWGSHYGTIISVISLFSSTSDVLDTMKVLPVFSDNKGEISKLVEVMNDYEFVFLLHLMKKVLGITNDLSQTLQRKDQDLPNAMSLVNVAKRRLQELRNDGGNDLLVDVGNFCVNHDIDVPDMDALFIPHRRSRRTTANITNEHYFIVYLLKTVVDYQIDEINDRFDNINIELLFCMACLDQRHSFSSFDKQKLIEFAKFYPLEFDDAHLLALDNQLDNYIADMQSNEDFKGLKGIADLSQKMVQKQKDIGFPLVYMLVKLALVLLVATVTVERAFSAMNLIKTVLCNKMGDIWLNDCLVTYIERDIFETIDNETIMYRFQDMKNRRMLL